MEGTQKPQPVSTKLLQIAAMAARDPQMIFTSLAHLLDVELLKEAYHKTRKDAAPGLDGVTAQDYASNLVSNLGKLHETLKAGQYRAPAIKRVWLDKEDGSKRPIGIPEFEDKIVQCAVSMILAAVYEQDFNDCSYGFRQGRSAHQALSKLRESCLDMKIAWIVDADIRGFFDSLDRNHLHNIIKQRVNDGGILRLIGKWLNAGVVDGQTLSYPELGTPQGGVISPLLANIYLHTVLDNWFCQQVKPTLKGRSMLIRFADDFIIGCEREDDARLVMQMLPARLAQFGLAIHPQKTQLLRFANPRYRPEAQANNGTFNFLGFTHYWTKARCGYWVIKRKTDRKRIRRTCKRV